MRETSILSRQVVLPFLLLILTSCASTGPGDRSPEEFGSADIHAHGFAGSNRAACEAARRALLSQGYVVGEATASLVKGRKNFQPRLDTHVQIEFHVVCAPNGKGSNSTTVFANAVRDRYSLKKTSSSASLGVGALGSVSLPFGSSDESLVKVASETIDNQDFYERFFTLIERYADAGGDPEADAEANAKANEPADLR